MTSANDRLGKHAKDVKKDLEEMAETIGDAAQEKLDQVWQRSLGLPRARGRRSPRVGLRL